jgi:uncharacterized membrane protein YdbT with pleckstrin-like domain
MPNELPYTQPKLHWINLAGSAIPFVVIMTATLIARIPNLFALALWFAAVPAPATALINYFTTSVKLYPRKLTYTSGFFYRITLDLPLGRIESVRVSQTLLGRVVGYGRVTVIAIGSSPITTPNIYEPDLFRAQLVARQLDDVSVKPQA